MPDYNTLKDMDFKGKKVFLRVDFNVPLDENGKVRNDKRIRALMPTIKYLIENNAKTAVVTHAGRPKGKVVENLRTNDIAGRLGELLGKPVKKVDHCVGDDVKKAVDGMEPGDVLMLENIRFYPEEKSKDEGERERFAKDLAEPFDIYINDAFGNCHRKHASMTSITNFIPGCAGLLVEKEIKMITAAMDNPKKPFIAVMGGVKLETKIPVIEHLAKDVDKIILGGAMIFNFYKAQGLPIGKSVCNEEYVSTAGDLMEKYKDKLVLPVDVVVGDRFDKDANTKIVKVEEIPDEWLGLDIGPETVKLFKGIIKDAKTIIWNGPMGAFEIEKFADGTKEMAKAIAGSNAVSVVGGGDSAAAVEEYHLQDKMTHVSTGGGASLAMFEGKKLPALTALEENKKKF